MLWTDRGDIEALIRPECISALYRVGNCALLHVRDMDRDQPISLTVGNARNGPAPTVAAEAGLTIDLICPLQKGLELTTQHISWPLGYMSHFLIYVDELHRVTVDLEQVCGAASTRGVFYLVYHSSRAVTLHWEMIAGLRALDLLAEKFQQLGRNVERVNCGPHGQCIFLLESVHTIMDGAVATLSFGTKFKIYGVPATSYDGLKAKLATGSAFVELRDFRDYSRVLIRKSGLQGVFLRCNQGNDALDFVQRSTHVYHLTSASHGSVQLAQIAELMADSNPIFPKAADGTILAVIRPDCVRAIECFSTSLNIYMGTDGEEALTIAGVDAQREYQNVACRLLPSKLV